MTNAWRGRRITLCPYTEGLTEGMSTVLRSKDPAAMDRQ